MNEKSFRGKVCWITGASSGIGEALAKRLSSEGALLILSARNESNLNKVRSSCSYPDNVLILPCNLEDMDSLGQITRQAWNTFGRIDYAFLNAGIALRDLAMNTEMEMIKKVMTINFFGPAAITKSLLPMMVTQGSGTLVVTSSISGKFGLPKLSAYAASKHALHGFFESVRAEHQKDGIKVIMVVPGLIRTGISVHALTGQGKFYGKMQESLATGMSPDDCAKKIARGVLKRKNEVIVGGSERFTILVNRLFPGLMAYIIRNHPLKKLKSLGLVPKAHQPNGK